VSGRSEAIIERMHALHPRLIDLSLGRLQALLRKLGHPERALPPVVHVAGTNGKGSTCATLRAIGEAAGQRVHVYSSRTPWFAAQCRVHRLRCEATPRPRQSRLTAVSAFSARSGRSVSLSKPAHPITSPSNRARNIGSPAHDVFHWSALTSSGS